MSVFDPQIMTQLLTDGASQNNIKGAQNFFENVLWNYNASKSTPKPYCCVYGTDLPTTYAFTYTAPDTWQPQLGLLFHGGDGIVPATSAQFAVANPAKTYRADGVDHLNLITDTGVLNTIVGWMGL